MQQLPLHPRPDFGGQPWPSPVSEFNVNWLTQTFVPQQRARRDTVVNAVNEGNKRIDAARAAVTTPVIGDRRKNGIVYSSPEDQQLARAARTIAERQLIQEIAAIKADVDQATIQPLKEMERAAMTAKTLAERVFDKMSCLARVNAGMDRRALVSFKANAAMLADSAEPIVLHKMAQNAIDTGSPEDLIAINAILNANLKVPRDQRTFMNQTLLELVNPPEFVTARPLLASVVDMHNEAYAAWAKLANHVGQASIMRIGRGLAKMKMPGEGE